MSRGMPRILGSHQQLEEAKKDPPQRPAKGALPCQHLDFRLLTSRTVRDTFLLL